MTGQRPDLLTHLVGGGAVRSLDGEAQLSQQPRQLAQLVALAHKAEQHVVDVERRIQQLFRFLEGRLVLGQRSDFSGGRGTLAGGNVQLAVAAHRIRHRLHHPGQVEGEHIAPVHQVVAPLPAQPLQHLVAVHRLRHRRHGEGGQVVEGQRAQVRRQEGRHVLGQIGLDGQRHYVAGIDLVRLSIHPEVDQGVPRRAVVVAAVEIKVHRYTAIPEPAEGPIASNTLWPPLSDGLPQL